MAKKLLSEAQVRKFMGLANLDANLSSNFLNEMYGEKDKKKMEEEKHDDELKEEKHEDEVKEEKHGDEKKVMKEEEDEMDEGMYKMKRDDDPMEEKMEMEMDMDADAEGGDIDGAADVELDEEEVSDAKSALEKIQAVLDKLMGGAGPEMDDDPADEPAMDMDDEPEMMEEEVFEESEVSLSEEEIVQEVARRVAKRINEAARAQKKADKLLGRKKK